MNNINVVNDNKVMSFDLSGKVAFFKKPDVNTEVYFTYNNIHKVALLGILGAIIGLKGYRNQEIFGSDRPSYPEFYEKLNQLKISIVPNGTRGYFNKKVQYFNNSVGYASSETGGNLMVFEQWLENPSWSIYLLNDGSIDSLVWNKLCNNLLNNKSRYMPYLGKNDFPASITNVEWVNLEHTESHFIKSLFIGKLEDLDESETTNDDMGFIFTEYSPIALERDLNFYQFGRAIFTNYKVSKLPVNTYSCNGKVLSFY